MASSSALRGYPLVLVQAPPGFGKTSLLTQWRREHLAQGAVVAWLSSDARDDPQRFVRSLVMAVRQGAGRPSFGRTLLGESRPQLARATSWLAEVAHTAMDAILIVDEAERLPADSAEVLVYLMRNAPPNLRIVVAARPELNLAVEDLVDYGQCKVVGPSLLRFQFEETISLTRSRFGVRADVDTAARLHELVEGWPLGLQLVLAALSSSADPHADLALLTRQDDLGEQTVGLLLSHLDRADTDFLSRVAIVDLVRPELCRAIVDEPTAGEWLARLAHDTPIFTPDERGWLRMHQLVRDVLRRRFMALPEMEQAQAHAGAARWLADNDLLETAGRHALAAGQSEWAYELAERSLYRDLMAYGREGAVRDWLGRLPVEELDRRPRLLLAIAWTLAASVRHEEGAKLVTRILAKPGIDDAVRCECSLILASVAFYSDDPDHFAELSGSWNDPPPSMEPFARQFFAMGASERSLLAGETALARRLAQQVVDSAGAASYAGRFAQCLVGMTYLRDAQVERAERAFRAVLVAAEADLGRRSQISCLAAALLAAALWDMDRTSEAATVLANRLDVLEQTGPGDTVVLAYRTQARGALINGAEDRAIGALDALYAVGLSRRLPSVCVLSLGEQIRLHARRFRFETCRELLERVDELLAKFSPAHGPIWNGAMHVERCVLEVYTAVAGQQWRRALTKITESDIAVQQLRQKRLQLEVRGLRALCLDRCGEDARALLREAADVAHALGLRRLFADVHPLLADLVSQVSPDGGGEAAPAAGLAGPRRDSGRAAGVRALPSAVLTPKEREVLEQLARNLSNKEIALAMQVGEQAIKWHVKNLFAKLDAGTRKQVVQRARIFGLLQDEA
jgi:LuxR family maltose regulon positive regulatory protein